MSILDLTDDEIFELINKRSFKENLLLLEAEWADYGKVKHHENGLIEFVTGGWSDNEELIRYFTNIRAYNFSKNYVGYIRGGSHFFYEKNEQEGFRRFTIVPADD